MTAVLEHGALGTCLSGSGPTVLVFCREDADELQSIIKETWYAAGITARTYHLRIAEEGVREIAY